MEIPGVEFAERCEFRPGADEQRARFVIGGFGSPQRLQMAIDAHQRQAEHLAELSLRERQRTGIAFRQPGEFGALELLAKEMSNPRHTVPAAVVGDTFAKDRRVDQGFPPDGESDAGPLRKHGHELIVGNRTNQGASHGTDRMVHALQKKPLGIRPIARVMKREILPGPRPQRVISGHDALENDRRGFRFIALSEEIFTGGKFLDFTTQSADGSSVGIIDGGVVLELSQKDVAWRHLSETGHRAHRN